MSEDIVKAERYNKNTLECLDFWMFSGINPLVASAVKYVWRFKYKNGIHDLKKALVFIDRALERGTNDVYFTEKVVFVTRDLLEDFDDFQYDFIITSCRTVSEDYYIDALKDMKIMLELLANSWEI
jgi:hypothetical protein